MSSNYLHKKIYLAISDAAADVATCWYFLRKKMMNGNGGRVSRSSLNPENPDLPIARARSLD